MEVLAAVKASPPATKPCAVCHQPVESHAVGSGNSHPICNSLDAALERTAVVEAVETQLLSLKSVVEKEAAATFKHDEKPNLNAHQLLRPLFTIWAPSGYGKTIAATVIARKLASRHPWFIPIQVDFSDGDKPIDRSKLEAAYISKKGGGWHASTPLLPEQHLATTLLARYFYGCALEILWDNYPNWRVRSLQLTVHTVLQAIAMHHPQGSTGSVRVLLLHLDELHYLDNDSPRNFLSTMWSWVYRDVTGVPPAITHRLLVVPLLTGLATYSQAVSLSGKWHTHSLLPKIPLLSPAAADAIVFRHTDSNIVEGPKWRKALALVVQSTGRIPRLLACVLTSSNDVF